jgi:chaperonin GroES
LAVAEPFRPVEPTRCPASNRPRKLSQLHHGTPLERPGTAPKSALVTAAGVGCAHAPNVVEGSDKEVSPMTFRPLHDRVVVRRITPDQKTAGGIIIPDTAQEKPQQGEVIAVGLGARDETGKLIPLDVKAGDTVLFGKWSGNEVKIDGQELLIMKESDILGVIANTGAALKRAA